MFSLEYTIFNINTKITLNFSKSAAMRLIFKGLKNEFDSVVVNESSVFDQTFQAFIKEMSINVSIRI